MADFIVLLLDKLIKEITDNIIVLVRLYEEIEQLQTQFPELANLFEDEKVELDNRIGRLDLLKANVIELKKKFSDPTGAARIIFYNEMKEEISTMDISIDKNKNASIKIVDKAGNDAKVDGAPAWSLSDPSLASLDVAADGMSAKIIPSGSLGSCEVSVKCDADVGAGVEEISGSALLAFLPGKAVGVLLSLSDEEPAPQPAE